MATKKSQKRQPWRGRRIFLLQINRCKFVRSCWKTHTKNDTHAKKHLTIFIYFKAVSVYCNKSLDWHVPLLREELATTVVFSTPKSFREYSLLLF